MHSYLAIFFTHSGAIKFQRKLVKSGLLCQLLPVPRSLSSNCGIGARFEAMDYKDLIDDDIEKMFLVDDDIYILKYEVMD